MDELMRLYRKLEAEYGRQLWWPAETPYEVVVGAILTQNTSWRNVEKALANLKSAGALDERTLLDMGQGELEALIRPSGFYRQKAERLKLATRKWLELRSRLETGNWKPGTPELRMEWLSVKGIGRETADSILLYAMDRAIFVIDAYTRRFCVAELGKAFKDYDDYRGFFERNLPRELELYKEYHALIVEWGKSNRSELTPP